MNAKKILLVVLFVLVTAGVGYMLYRFFFAPAPTEVPPEEVATTTPPIGGGLEPGGERPPGDVVPGVTPGLPVASPIASGGLTVTESVDEDPVLSPSLTATGELTYYNQIDGKFYRVLADGTLVALSDRTFPAASSVEWSPGADKAVIEFPDSSKIVYDFTAQKQITLPKHWEDFSFTGDGERIAAKSLGVDPDNRWLISFASDGTDARLIEPLGDEESKVIVEASPDASTVAFSDTGEAVGFDTRDILLIGPNQENYPALRVEGFGFIPKWDPSGEHLLYSAASSADDFIPTLWFSDAKGDAIGLNRTNLGIRTWADKCTFADAETVYCAVPDDLPLGSGLERGVADGIPDSILRIDLVSGATSTVGRPETDTMIGQIVVAPDESRLYFTDAYGRLQEMRLR